MYPNLTPWLAVLLGAVAVAVAAVVVRRPVLRRLAVRQAVRRPTEAVLVVAGSVLGTAIIVGSLVVGDTLNRSVKDVAYTSLGPVDERVTSLTPSAGDRVSVRLAYALTSDPDIDGLLTARVAQASVVRRGAAGGRAEPRALLWEMETGAAHDFGAASGEDSGLGGGNPAPGDVVLNDELARSIGARTGDELVLHVFGRQVTLHVARVVPARGLAGVGLGASTNRNAFLPPGTLVGAALAAPGREWPQTVTFVSNRGGVESGVELTDRVVRKLETALGPLVGHGATIDTPKREVLDNAREAGDQLGSMFLFIGSFSIIAGILLLVQIFVMLAEERKSELGMLRAVGLKRSRLVLVFLVEGVIYATAATLIGLVVGIGVGRAVVVVAQRIFNAYADTGGGGIEHLTFAVTPVTLFNGGAAGLVIAVLTVLATSARISRVNIIAATRDLPTVRAHRARRGLVVVSSAAALVVGSLAAVAVGASAGAWVYLLPAVAAVLAVPALTRVLPRRAVHTGVALAVLLWGLLANTARPDMFDNSPVSTYIVLGSMLTFSAVFLVTANQRWLLQPLRPIVQRPSEAGLAVRLAIAYPTARSFRTGATLVMYSIVVFTLVLLTEIGAVIDKGVDSAIADGSGGFALRADYNPNSPIARPEQALRAGTLAREVAEVAPLVTVTALARDPGGRRSTPLPTMVVGVPPAFRAAPFPLDKRLGSLGRDDRAVWRAVVDDPRYVVVDAFFGATGGPVGELYRPGDGLTITDPRTGRTEMRTIAGIIANAQAFYGVGGQGFAFPALMSQAAVRAQFGSAASVSSVLVRTRAGVGDARVAAELQGRYLRSGLVATQLRRAVEQNFAATRTFFRLMEGFLALGLLVGISGLGVVMVRAVRERRRTIGVLRALGFRARTIQRSFLAESAFVALEGIVVGTALSVLTSYLLYANSAAFAGIKSGFPIATGAIALTVGVTFVASLLATAGPARRAAGIRPAVAVRVAD